MKTDFILVSELKVKPLSLGGLYKMFSSFPSVKPFLRGGGGLGESFYLRLTAAIKRRWPIRLCFSFLFLVKASEAAEKPKSSSQTALEPLRFRYYGGKQPFLGGFRVPTD